MTTLRRIVSAVANDDLSFVKDSIAATSENVASAAISAALAESVSGPTYASTAAGLAATASGGYFAVDNGDGTVTIYLNDAGTAVAQRTLATTAALAGTGGAGIIGQYTRASAILANIPPVTQRLTTIGYANIFDGGQASYKRVASEPAHSGKFQDAGGQWWELDETIPAPEMFGAIAGSDATAAIQNALDFAVAKSLGRVVGNRVYIIATGDITLKTGVDLELKEISHTATTFAFQTGASGWRSAAFRVQKLWLRAGGHHFYNINGTMRTCTFEVIEAYAQDNNYGLIRASTGAGLYGNQFNIPYYKTNTTGATAVACAAMSEIHLPGNQNMSNVWEVGYAYGGTTNPIIHHSSTNASFQKNNVYNVRVAEVANAGVVWLGGHIDSEVYVRSYDNSDVVGDIVRLYNNGSRCHGNRLDVDRTTGTLASGVYDVNLLDAWNTTIYNFAENSLAPLVINNPNMPGTRIIGSAIWPPVVTGETNRRAFRDWETFDERPAFRVVIAGGVLALGTDALGPIIYRTIDTEGNAAADDLTSITGGRDGQILVLATTANARDVTLVHSAALKLSGGTNKTLGLATESIVLMRVGGIWRQIGDVL